jgi:hypothetical protein
MLVADDPDTYADVCVKCTDGVGRKGLRESRLKIAVIGTRFLN